MTAAIDTSEPVPAVVGMHASGAVAVARHQEEALLLARGAAVREDRVGDLRGVHDRPAPDGEEGVRARLLRCGRAFLHDVRRRVLRHAVEDPGDLEAAVLDTGLHLVDQAGAADDLVGDDEDAVRALLHELEAGALDQAAARDDPGVVDVLVEVLEARHLTSVQRRRLGAHFASSRSCRPAPSSIVR
jgi:hypothetical protein